jgi:hypothetical protein
VSVVRVAALLLSVLVLAVAAGCGGGDEVAPQTPGEPASMPIPQASEPPGGDNGADESTDGSATPDEEATAEPNGTGQGTTTPPADDTGATSAPETAVPEADTGGGTTAPSTESDGPSNDTPPPAGSDAEQFEDFCAQNPGAC